MTMRTVAPILLLAGCAIGCSQQAAPPPVAKVKVTIPAGTQVRLMLMKQVESGVDEVGSTAPLIVEEALTVDGRVVVARGTPVVATVAWSRREDAFGALLQKPARLDLKLGEAEAVGGVKLPLSMAKDDPEAVLRFDRGNTAKFALAEQVAELMKDPKFEASLKELDEMVRAGNLDKLQDEPRRQSLLEIAQKLGMKETEKVIQSGEIARAGSLLAQIRQGAAISALASGGTLAAVGAVSELANLAGSVGDRLSGILRGRNILAHIGTRVTAVTSREVVVEVDG